MTYYTMTFCSTHNGGCNPNTLAGLDTALEMVYIYDNHSRIHPVDAYESARDLGEDGGQAKRVGKVTDRRL